MKLALYGISQKDFVKNSSEDPANYLPFSFSLDSIELVDDFDESDRIFVYLDYLECNRDYAKAMTHIGLRANKHKLVFWTMSDNPSFAYLEGNTTKIVCQPLYGQNMNRDKKVIVAPLTMRHFEWEMVKDSDFINSLADQDKQFDFLFHGQISYAGRAVLRRLSRELPNFDYKETKPIWHIKTLRDRVQLNKDFCQRISRAKYCFAPRGVGSSSFRMFQAMMSGTVPIVWGQNEFPFSDEIDWNKVVINVKNPETFNYRMLLDNENDYNLRRQRCLEIWHKYVKMDSSYRHLVKKYFL